MKRKVAITAAVVVFVLAAAIVVYPLISNHYSEKKQSVIYTEYSENVKDKTTSELADERAKAEQYNRALYSGVKDEENKAIAEYDSLLNIAGNGIMGYINIPKIDVRLPIYHSSDADTLETGCGHLEFTSLPIGGKDTHSVITAHSGMSSQKLFSDIDILEQGDTFYIEVLGEKIYYEVARIKTVLPYEINDLKIESGKDLVSLVTCTPFGVNTHRLIVTGERIELSDHNEVLEKTPNVPKANRSTWKTEYIKAILTGIGIFASVLILYISINFIKRKLKRREKTEKQKG